MSFEAQMTAIYRLFYKAKAREAWFGRDGVAPVSGLTARELADLRAIPAARLSRIVELHRGDIGRGWYQGRFPASWMALQGALGLPEDSVVALLTESDAFERRVNDDADGRALAGLVDELMRARRLGEAPWLGELLAYERVLGGAWDGLESLLWQHGDLAAHEFEWDVAGIYAALMGDGMFPTGEEQVELCLVFRRDSEGVSEAAVEVDVAIALAVEVGMEVRELDGGAEGVGEVPVFSKQVVQQARMVLRELR